MTSKTETRMKRGLLAFATLLVLLLAAAFTLYKIFLPDYLADQIKQAVQERGLSEISVEVAEVAPSHAVLKNFRIGKQKGIFIREIRVTFSRASLAQKRVHAVHLHGAEFDFSIADRKVNPGVLANYKSIGPLVLPFDSLTISAAALRLDWEARRFQIPLEVKMQNRHDDSLALDLHAHLANNDLRLQALCTIDSLHGSFKLELDRLAAALLQHAQKSYSPSLPLSSEGQLNAKAQLWYKGAKWRAHVFLDGDSLQVEYDTGASNGRVHASRLQADLALSSDSLSVVKLAGIVNGAPVEVTANLDLETLASAGGFRLAAVQAGVLDEVAKIFSPGLYLKSSGALSAKGSYDFDGKNLEVHFALSGKNFSSRFAVASHALQVFPAELEVDANLALPKEKPAPRNDPEATRPRLRLRDFEARAEGMKIFYEPLGLALDSVSALLPVHWQKQELHDGKFSVAHVRWREIELSKLTSTWHWKNRRLDFSASSPLFENARLDLSGWIDHAQEKIAGELSLKVPAFTLQNSAALIPAFPSLRDQIISGMLALDGRMKMAEGGVIPYFQLKAAAVSWQSKLTKARVDSITGALTLTALKPLTSAQGQRFTFASATFGSFIVTAGEVMMSLANSDSIPLHSFSCSWAGGKLSSRDFVLKPAAQQVHFVLHVEAVDLQAILDFIKYQGVKGWGKIYGELPVTLRWGEKKRLTFGDGYLEARPQAGVLQLSPENAQALLGKRKAIDPQNASLEDQVSLMVINALQDMAYTNLRIEFKNEPGRGLMTYVRVQGHGPRSDPEKQIPIGGFNVNINHLDDLLNSLIWPNLSAGKAKLE